MTHQWHDSFRHEKTPAHHLDPRSKLFIGLIFTGNVLLTPRFTLFQKIAYPGLILLAAILAGVSWKSLFKRFLTILPFALLMAASAWFSKISMPHWGDVLGKAICSIAGMTLLTLTTPFPELLRALEQIHLPRFFVMLLAFLYRYGDVLYQETVQLERAWTARYFGKYWLKQWVHLGNLLASLFIRSYERAERIFAAMQARGFSSGAAGLNVLHFSAGDAVFVMSGLSLIAALRWVHFG